MGHALNQNFFKYVLHNTSLRKLLDYVVHDNTLDLELRNNKINIYYRGAGLILLRYTPNPRGVKVSFEQKYIINNDYIKQLADSKLGGVNLSNIPLNVIESIIPYLKQVIDFYFTCNIGAGAKGKQKLEQDAQQAIVRENSYGKLANSTDYFCLDTEYTYDNARFDIIGIEWPSDKYARKIRSDCRLTFFEVKYGDGAIDGDAGLLKHIKDFVALSKNQVAIASIKQDMELVLKQKCALQILNNNAYKYFKNLGQIYLDSLENNPPASSPNLDITINSEYPIEYIFLLVNHDPDSSKMFAELDKVFQQFTPQELENIYIATASELGYGLYRRNKDKNKKAIDRFISLNDYYQELTSLFHKPQSQNLEKEQQ